MKVKRLTINHFKGVVSATLLFNEHTLLVGTNNVGKSTVFEALELVLGPDRLNRFPPIDEYDFYNADYLTTDVNNPKKIRIEVVLTSLSDDLIKKYGGYTEHWYHKEKRTLDSGEIALVDDPESEICLRLETIGEYDAEDDDFIAQTYFSHSPFENDGELKVVSKKVKQGIGFLYLRTLRTGSRALSLERGTLLDIILRLGNIRTGLWEETITRLKNLSPPIDESNSALKPVLDAIEKRISQYISINATDSATALFVSDLTREHLRKTISFFLTITPDQAPVPFKEVGTGTINTLMLALLTFIAEIKNQDVIFAMEEPEIALPPHTQRRIAHYLLNKTSQCFVTSHSPYIIEMFDPSSVQLLKRNEKGELTSTPVELQGSIKPKSYRKHARRGLCEAMLGKGVILVEGITEQIVLWAVAKKLEESSEQYYPLDLSGVTIFSNDGDGLMDDFGAFYKGIGLKCFALLDKKDDRPATFNARIPLVFDHCLETDFIGIELLLSTEVSIDVQWQLLEQIRISGEKPKAGIPTIRPQDDNIRDLTTRILKGSKGDGTAGRLIELCPTSELPTSIIKFLTTVYKEFPAPAPTPVTKELNELLNKQA